MIGKLMNEMERALEIRDKVLAEFVLDLAKNSKTVMEFEKQLEANGAEFSIELISSMYALITKMLPECFPRVQHFRLSTLRTNGEMIDDPVREAELMQKSIFEQVEDFDRFGSRQTDDCKRQELSKLFPSLAQKNQRNKEEIDLFDSESEASEHARPRQGRGARRDSRSASPRGKRSAPRSPPVTQQMTRSTKQIHSATRREKSDRESRRSSSGSRREVRDDHKHSSVCHKRDYDDHYGR